jgi:hypothetical protein
VPRIIQLRIAPAGRTCWRHQREVEASFLLVVARILTVAGSSVERVPLNAAGESNRIGLVTQARRSRLCEGVPCEGGHEEQNKKSALSTSDEWNAHRCTFARPLLLNTQHEGRWHLLSSALQDQ